MAAISCSTRNPLARAWERWTPANAIAVQTSHGAVVSMAHEVEPLGPVDLVLFTTTFTSTDWDGPQVSHSILRFLAPPLLASFLSGAGFEIMEQFGDWDRRPFTDTSPENVIVARRSRT